MLHGLLVVGVLFGLGFLMVVGVHSALRDLLTRQLYPPHLYQGRDFGEGSSEEEGPIRIAKPVSRDSLA
jgi:hypothetical protein